jgi:cystathionine beta-lyase
MTFDFDHLPNRRSTESAKWRAHDEGILPMWVADMDFRSPEPVIQALHERVEHGIFGYPRAPEGLRGSIIDWLQKRHGWQVAPEELVIIPGVVTGFHLAAHAVTHPGDGVLVQTPTYGPFFRVAPNVHLVQQEMELTPGPDGQYELDLDAFRAAINGRTRIFMLCNPQNPTGRVFRQDELESMAQICLEHDIIICSDEIHSDLVFSDQRHIPIAMIDPEIAAKTITLLAPSKTFNIAGLEASVAVIQDQKLRQQFDGARLGLVGWVNLLGQIAMLAAYQHGEKWLDALLLYLEANRDYLVEFINHQIPGVQVTSPQGTYLAWLNCRDANIPGKPSEYLLKEARVAMNDGEWFGKGGTGFVRLNFGCPRQMLEEALIRIKKTLEDQSE